MELEKKGVHLGFWVVELENEGVEIEKKDVQLEKR